MVMVAAVVACFVVYVRAEKQVDQANELRQRSFLLADELRQSSDDLTRMVRTYVATGDPIYKRHFQEILDIRDGKSPRPQGYQNSYWNLVQSDDSRPTKQGDAAPLLQEMRRTGFTDAEFAKLAEAKANSDALTRTEFAAMALIESTHPMPDANRQKATDMLHDEAYHQAKVGIMRPIFELNRMADVRTLQAVQAAQSYALHARELVVVIGLLMMLMLWFTRRSLIAILGGPVDEVFASIARLGGGDFSTAVGRVAAGMDNSVLGWLGKTQTNLARLDRERQQAEEAIRESERRFHRALDDMMEGCTLIAYDWTFLYINDAAAQHGRQPRSKLTGRKMTDAYPGIDETELYEAFSRVMTSRVPLRCEVSYTFPDGGMAWFEFSIAPTQEGIFVLSLDITDRRLFAERLSATNMELEKQVVQRTSDLQAALDAAKQASQAKSTFLSSISHELRTPMNAILGFSQLLLMRPLPDEQKGPVEEILRAGHHLLALIDDLLDLTRVEAGQVKVSSEPVDLSELAHDAVSIVTPLLNQHKLTLDNRIDQVAWVLADPVRLRQVIVNLLSNASKYNREGGRVVLEVLPRDGQRLRLCVRDTGFGIPAEQLPRLFRTFERLGAAHQGIEGTGIGLALSRHLVELMGGEIGVESQVNEGTTFWIDLPLKPSDQDQMATLPRPALVLDR